MENNVKCRMMSRRLPQYIILKYVSFKILILNALYHGIYAIESSSQKQKLYFSLEWPDSSYYFFPMTLLF